MTKQSLSHMKKRLKRRCDQRKYNRFYLENPVCYNTSRYTKEEL